MSGVHVVVQSEAALKLPLKQYIYEYVATHTTLVTPN
jgi:hypothetical protein